MSIKVSNISGVLPAANLLAIATASSTFDTTEAALAPSPALGSKAALLQAGAAFRDLPLAAAPPTHDYNDNGANTQKLVDTITWRMHYNTSHYYERPAADHTDRSSCRLGTAQQNHPGASSPWLTVTTLQARLWTSLLADWMPRGAACASHVGPANHQDTFQKSARNQKQALSATPTCPSQSKEQALQQQNSSFCESRTTTAKDQLLAQQNDNHKPQLGPTSVLIKMQRRHFARNTIHTHIPLQRKHGHENSVSNQP